MSQISFYKIGASTTLNVAISGTETPSTPSLIFLHFWGGSSRTWAPVISALPSSYHCIAIGFRGWGSSTGPQDPSAYSMAHLANDIEILIPRLGLDKYILIGHSMGGKVAQLIAGRNQVSGLQGLVLVAPAPPSPLELEPEMREQQIGAYSSAESAEFVVRNVLTSSKISSEAVSFLVQDMLKGNESARKAWPAYGMGEDIVAEVKEIRIPVLVLAGELDRVEPVERLRQEVLGNVYGAKLVVMGGRGHLLPIEAPEGIAKNIKYFAASFII